LSGGRTVKRLSPLSAGSSEPTSARPGWMNVSPSAMGISIGRSAKSVRAVWSSTGAAGSTHSPRLTPANPLAG
jgi:hypothetical protein